MHRKAQQVRPYIPRNIFVGTSSPFNVTSLGIDRKGGGFLTGPVIELVRDLH